MVLIPPPPEEETKTTPVFYAGSAGSHLSLSLASGREVNSSGGCGSLGYPCLQRQRGRNPS